MVSGWNYTDAGNIKIEANSYVEVKKKPLNIRERNLYCALFDEKHPIEEPLKVSEPLKECISQLVGLGLDRKEKFAGFVPLSKVTIDNNLNSAERDGLHVINGKEDAEVICRYEEGGEWKFFATISKSLIERFCKHRHKKKYPTYSFGTINETTQSVTLANTSTITGTADISYK